MKKFLALILLAACGVDDGELFDDSPDGGVGQIEQAFRGKNTPNFQFGTQTGSTRQRCNKTSSGQVCAIPPSKTLRYCIETTQSPFNFTVSEYNRIRAIVEGFDSISDFTLNEVGAPGSGACNSQSPAYHMAFFKVAVGSSGTASNDVKDYAGLTLSSLSSLTEGPGVVGTMGAWSFCQANIDIVDILAKGTSSTQDNNGIDHAAAHTMLGCLGIGGRSGDGGRASRNLFNPATTATNVSSGEACALLEFTLTDPGQYNLKTPACTSD